MPKSRPSLYSSPIQHVLVLQEEEGLEDEDSPNYQSTNPSPPVRTEFTHATRASPVSGQTPGVYPWRIANRMRTANGALVLCLNIGVDPPDVFKPNPCAKLECWTDPNLENSTKSLQQIGSALRGQYEQWQPKAKYRLCADPTASELKRACMSLRRAAKDERVLFHYNGHGVPKPTANGEIWVFNHNYTQYIPMDLMDLQDALGSPSLMVFDCNSAGIIHRHFKRIVEHQERNWQQQSAANSDKIVPSHRNSIFLGACGENELLPTNPALPADLFTACLTTPIKTLLRWFAQKTLIQGITPEMIDRVPGNLNLRQTPLGEINWIFTAVTDAIAWNVLPRERFKMLYRQDLLLASLMRNFLLADRIMRSYGCTPVSLPALPETHNHHLWQACDLAVEQLLSQLPKLIAVEDERLRMAQVQQEGSTTAQSATAVKSHSVTASHHATPCSPVESSSSQHYDVGSEAYSSTATSRKPPTGRSIETHSSASDHTFTKNGGLDGLYVSTTFFEDQMKAFDVWLDMGPDQRDPPEQLPIVLQALLSPHYRVKVLPLFSKYMQTGPVAVDLVLSVGMFPYVQKLLESQSIELRPDLVFIWSKILALDNTCRTDLVKEEGEIFFVRFLEQQHLLGTRAKPVYVAVALFVLSVVANGHADRCVEVGTLEACLRHLNHEDQFVRRWACLCLTAVIQNGSRRTQSSVIGWDELLRLVRKSATEDAAPDVRAAATSTLAVIMGSTLRFLSPGNAGGQSSHESRNEYQPNSPAAENRPMGENITGSESFSPGANVIGVRGNHVESLLNIESCEDARSTSMLARSELPDEPGPEFTSDERDVLLKIGFEVAEIGRKESSVLVRREVAIAIAQAVRYQHGRFVRAAISADFYGIDDSLVDDDSADEERCELVYRRLWTTLSELAFDPHPIVAALARRSYDTVSETLLRKRAVTGNSRKISASGVIANDDPMFALQEQPERVPSNNEPVTLKAEHSPTDSVNLLPLKQVESEPKAAGSNYNPDVPRLKRYEAHSEDYDSNLSQNGSFVSRSSDAGSKKAQSMENSRRTGAACDHTANVNRPHIPVDRSADLHVPTGSIHVRSTSGSFDLNVSSRLPYLSAMPRVNSASLVPPVTGSLSSKGFPAAVSNKDISASPSLERMAEGKEDAAGSLPKIALAKGVGMLMKTVTQQLHIPGLASASTTLPRSYGSNSSTEVREDKDAVDVKSLSPPRPPRRTLSYQVLNAASSLSPSSEIPIFASSRPTYFASPGTEAADDGLGRFLKKLPRGYERLYLSGHGDAALSLYEWSSAYISRVEFDAAAPSRVSEEENVPRYAALWDKFIKTSGRIPSESLRAFALLGAGANGMGVRSGATVDNEGNNYTFSEISSYAMGAGGGAVLAMAFLPRDIGMGDDQLIATGDSTGSVGVYDIRSGNCQGSFGIPFPPGIPEVGVSSILCLNRPSPTASEVSLSVGHSQSALIMAGAYDGRVAVFKSDLQGPKYRIMSTFQASGQSYWSKVGTSREPGHQPSQHDMMNGTQNSPQSSCSYEISSPLTFSDTVRESGNGLVLAFDSDSSYLAAAGCDMENVRVWDLSREQCVWEGAVVPAGTWPTAVTMWGRINPALFVVGASDGRINVVDIRERSRVDVLRQPLVPMGRLSEPIISLGTCPPVGRFSGEVVVSADIGGEIVFWDARWNIDTGVEQGLMASEPELSRIKAHRSNLTAMAVHPLGTLIASGSTARCVKVFGPNRTMLKMLCSHETGNEFESATRIPPVTSLGFQPESNLLAIGAVDSSVMIYGKPDTFPGVRAHVDQVTEAERSALYEYWR